MNDRRLRTLDLFSGVGAFSLGLERAGGFRTVAFCELDPFRRAVLAKHWPGVPIHDDVRTLDARWLIEEGICEMAGKLKKLTLEQVDAAVELYDAGESLADLAVLFSVTRQSMHDLLKRRTIMRPQLRYGVENHFYRGGEKASEQDRAQNIVDKAISRGKLIPQPCEKCGANGLMADGRREVQAHHDDYSKPLQVRWLCQRCHHQHHKEIYSQKESPEPTQIDVICGGFP